ncbi:hypothetical protein HK097_003286 [Rhizophlyctis rosea]|uniref:Uncharacterized protein n=1 Tax=Rhizophlyctis rosea TaxID=64517 RepID=A0AAD5X7I0_9FUNG|nr:hypothetical protein HK097_003286 [Rhizophlyctis rosea]
MLIQSQLLLAKSPNQAFIQLAGKRKHAELSEGDISDDEEGTILEEEGEGIFPLDLEEEEPGMLTPTLVHPRASIDPPLTPERKRIQNDISAMIAAKRKKEPINGRLSMSLRKRSFLLGRQDEVLKKVLDIYSGYCSTSEISALLRSVRDSFSGGRVSFPGCADDEVHAKLRGAHSIRSVIHHQREIDQGIERDTWPEALPHDAAILRQVLRLKRLLALLAKESSLSDRRKNQLDRLHAHSEHELTAILLRITVSSNLKVSEAYRSAMYNPTTRKFDAAGQAAPIGQVFIHWDKSLVKFLQNNRKPQGRGDRDRGVYVPNWRPKIPSEELCRANAEQEEYESASKQPHNTPTAKLFNLGAGTWPTKGIYDVSIENGLGGMLSMLEGLQALPGTDAAIKEKGYKDLELLILCITAGTEIDMEKLSAGAGARFEVKDYLLNIIAGMKTGCVLELGVSVDGGFNPRIGEEIEEFEFEEVLTKAELRKGLGIIGEIKRMCVLVVRVDRVFLVPWLPHGIAVKSMDLKMYTHELPARILEELPEGQRGDVVFAKAATNVDELVEIVWEAPGIMEVEAAASDDNDDREHSPLPEEVINEADEDIARDPIILIRKLRQVVAKLANAPSETNKTYHKLADDALQSFIKVVAQEKALDLPNSLISLTEGDAAMQVDEKEVIESMILVLKERVGKEDEKNDDDGALKLVQEALSGLEKVKVAIPDGSSASAAEPPSK